MSKKKRTKRSGHPGRVNHLSLVGKPSSADTALQLRFHAWFRKHAAEYDEHPDAEAVRALTALLFETAAVRGLSLAHPTIDVLDTVLGLIADDEELFELEAAALDVLTHYLDFLHDVDVWAGSDEEFETSMNFLVAMLDTLEDDEPETILDDLLDGLRDLPDVPVADQLAALDEMTPIAAVDKLLAWIGTSKPVTSTGALRLGDIEPVAALLGVRAVGKRGAPMSLPEKPGADRREVAAKPREVGSMWDVSELNRWWAALEETGIIEITPTRLRRGPRADDWESTHQSVALDIRIDVLGLYLTAWAGSSIEAIPKLATHALVQNLAQFSAAVSPQVHSEMSSNAIMEQMIAASPSGGVLDLARFAGELSQSAMRHFETMRMLSAEPSPDGSDRFVVAEAARPAFAHGIRRFRNSFGPVPTDAPPLDSPHPPGTVLRLKIALLESKPAVWRRVTVPADATFADLHHIIQAVFGWQNSHLHQFFEGDDWYSPEVIITDLRFQDTYEEEIEDEAAVAIGVFFEEPGDEVNYQYDFGDDWRHVIRLERIEPEGTDAGPHCIDGRGRAPLDDSFGVHGWAEKVRISQDPADPDHEDIREWLGLAPGEVLDPKHFDVAEADAALTPLRRALRR